MRWASASSVGPVAGGTAVTATGVEFTVVTAVRFGALEATSVTVNSTTSITAVLTVEVAGTVAVRVTTPEGTSSTGTLVRASVHARITLRCSSLVHACGGAPGCQARSTPPPSALRAWA